jgi:hypothetical protein
MKCNELSKILDRDQYASGRLTRSSCRWKSDRRNQASRDPIAHDGRGDVADDARCRRQIDADRRNLHDYGGIRIFDPTRGLLHRPGLRREFLFQSREVVAQIQLHATNRRQHA